MVLLFRFQDGFGEQALVAGRRRRLGHDVRFTVLRPAQWQQVQAWVPIDGTYDLGAGPRVDSAVQEQAYPLSRCMSCCLCMEVCPQFTEPTRFVGAAIINQVRLFNLHPTGAHLRRERLAAMMSDGGIHECSYAQNCVQICPHPSPLFMAK